MSYQMTWVYLIYDPHSKLFKIGRADDPYQRLKDLQREGTKGPYPRDFELLEAWFTTVEMERELHEEYAEFHVRGEWFDLGQLLPENMDKRWLCGELTGLSDAPRLIEGRPIGPRIGKFELLESYYAEYENEFRVFLSRQEIRRLNHQNAADDHSHITLRVESDVSHIVDCISN